jgi:hypothetical protein
MSAPDSGEAVFNYDDLSGQGLHDEISSIRIQPGVKVSLYYNVEGGEPRPPMWEVVAEGGIKEIANFKNTRIPNDEISAITVERVAPTDGGGGNGGDGGGGNGGGSSGPTTPSEGVPVLATQSGGLVLDPPEAFSLASAFPTGSSVALATPQGAVSTYRVQAIQPTNQGKKVVVTQPAPGQAAERAIQSGSRVRLFPASGNGGGDQIISGISNSALAIGGFAVFGSMLFVVASQ